MRKAKASVNMIRRLPRYLRKLDELSEYGITRISSAELGHQMGITPSQIRQDLSSFGEFGLQGYGYSVAPLRNAICDILGMNNGYRATLIGAGKLGRALMSNFGFENYGIDLECAFDIREELVGTVIDGIPVYDLQYLSDYLKNNHVDIAVLTVPKSSASIVAKILQDSGVDAIWNFTNTEIDVSNEKTLVESVHFSDSLLTLSYFLDKRRAESNI